MSREGHVWIEASTVILTKTSSVKYSAFMRENRITTTIENYVFAIEKCRFNI